MENERTEVKIVVLCVLAAVCVIIISVIALIGVWSGDDREDEKVEEEQKIISDVLGTFSKVQVTEKEQVSKYSENIIASLTNKNIDAIYDMTNPEYLEYFNLDKAGLKKVLQNKGFFGTVLTTNKYNTTTVDSNKCFRIGLSSSNNEYVDGTVNVIEYFPNDYKIAFDKFVFYKKDPIKYIREDLEITISNQLAFDSRYNVTISVTNNTDNAVYLNKNELHEFIYLVDVSGSEIGSATHVYAGQAVEISPNKTINMNLDFSLDDMSVGKIKSIKIKDVVASKTGVGTDIELGI